MTKWLRKTCNDIVSFMFNVNLETYYNLFVANSFGIQNAQWFLKNVSKTVLGFVMYRIISNWQSSKKN